MATPNWRRETCAWIPALPSSPGGKSGPAVPGDAASSLLLQVIGYQHEIKRPPDRALPPDYVTQIARWTGEGLVWPEAEGPLLQPSVISEAHRLHWAFQPLAAAPAPETVGRYPEANAADRFLLARLEAEGPRPAPLAGRRALIRRVTYDLTGLPPTPGEGEAFVATDAPQAYAELVDRLLAAPAYGERWGAPLAGCRPLRGHRRGRGRCSRATNSCTWNRARGQAVRRNLPPAMTCPQRRPCEPHCLTGLRHTM